jgi:hypothetical protein
MSSIIPRNYPKTAHSDNYAERLLRVRGIATLRTLLIWSTSFEMFARNGRWGTCGGCPRDAAGNVHPEFCTLTDRGDHQLTAAGLAESYQSEYTRQHDRAMKEIEER